MERAFDLNIDRILEDWDVQHAIREILANAMDERILTNSNPIAISKIGYNKWSIKDYGRGIKYEHFVQNENPEKHNHKGVIGKFGIGLKDALATLERKGVQTHIYSKHNDIRVARYNKDAFKDIITLHAVISSPTNPNMVGTEFVLDNVTDAQMQAAKDFFICFSDSELIEETRLGQILRRKEGQPAYICVNGLRISQEENFLFSYNITNINTQLNKAINRERNSVGRSAYAATIRNILVNATSEEVSKILGNDLSRYSYGGHHDEMSWKDVQLHAAELLNRRKNVVFVTSDQTLQNNDLVKEAEKGHEVVVIPTGLSEKIAQVNESKPEENKIRDFRQLLDSSC